MKLYYMRWLGLKDNMSLEKSIHISIFKMQVYAFQGPILPGQHSIERYLIEEQLKHILQANRIERKDWYVSLIKISYITLKLLL